MTALDAAAIEFHDYLWENVGVTEDWPIQISGDDESTDEFCRLMNNLQDAIKKSGYAKIKYQEGLIR